MQLFPQHQNGECTFCNEFAGKDNCNFRILFPKEEFPSRIILRTQNFVVIPGLGPIGEAYLLILPIEPYQCMALLPKNLYVEFLVIKDEITEALKSVYSPSIMFEHGPVLNCELTAGCCIEHAHMHLVSTSVDLLEELHKDAAFGKFGTHRKFSPMQVKSVIELKSWIDQGVAYLYYETGQGEQWGFPVTAKIESQFVRRKLAEKLGLAAGTWDWLVVPNQERVKTTWQKLTSILQRNI